MTVWAVGTMTETGVRGGFLEDGKGKPGFTPVGERPLVNRFRTEWFGLNKKQRNVKLSKAFQNKRDVENARFHMS